MDVLLFSWQVLQSMHGSAVLAAVSQEGPQQPVLQIFFAQGRQAQASSRQALGGMLDARKVCQLWSFTNLPLHTA